MKRRKFVRGLLAVPAVAAVTEAGQTPPPSTTPQQQPPPKPDTPARQEARQPQSTAKVPVTAADLAGDPAPQFFTPVQFAILEKLAEVMMPRLKGNPGALDAKAPEFLDFLISVSPVERQNSYRSGLEALQKQAKRKHSTEFHSLSAGQVDAIVKPLLVARPWPMDLPSDPLQSFLAQVHEDLRTATMNSREWAAATEKPAQFSRGFRGSGYYWAPIDPVNQG